MRPGDILKSYGINRDCIVRAINSRYRKKWVGGLCFSFENAGMVWAYECIPKVLAELNDRTDLLLGYWGQDEAGFSFDRNDNASEQRLMLLAFMLTWIEEVS